MAKTALVTGAGNRIGRAIAGALGVAGWNVAVHYHKSRASAENLVDEIKRRGSGAMAIQADLSNQDQLQAILPEINGSLGLVDCLINNAAVFERDDLNTLDQMSWGSHLAVNLTAPLLLTQAMASGLSNKANGNVINIVDQRVWNLTPHFVSYTISKSGLWTMTRTLALALAPRIRVNAIGPGPTLPSKRQTKAKFKSQWKSVPLQRQTTVEEIGEAILYILGAQAMTGQMIALDGGQHLGWSQSVASNGDDE
ncbi:MAG: SDR family oxidoreductase [Pseudomonadota bacterium]|nr:SDR family oxidoreductase [Pseudomonadota bacterium]